MRILATLMLVVVICLFIFAVKICERETEIFMAAVLLVIGAMVFMMIVRDSMSITSGKFNANGKAIKRLEEIRDEMIAKNVNGWPNGILFAIEALQSQPETERVCKWKSLGGMIYTPACDNMQALCIYNFKFCPYCSGRAMKGIRKYLSIKFMRLACKLWPQNPEVAKFIKNMLTEQLVTGKSITLVKLEDYSK